jgi:hypothetical protein
MSYQAETVNLSIPSDRDPPLSAEGLRAPKKSAGAKMKSYGVFDVVV